MSLNGLNKDELGALILRYKSELKKLRYQSKKVRDVIVELEAVRDGKPVSEVTAKPDVKTKPAKRGRKPKIRRKRVLSPWDDFLIHLITEQDRMLKRHEIDEMILKNGGDLIRSMEESKIIIKVSNVLQKLTKTKGLLVKYPANSKRGYYGLSNWFFGTTKQPKSKYATALIKPAPKEHMATDTPSTEATTDAETTPKRRGRKPGSTNAAKAAAAAVVAPKKRGRKPSVVVADSAPKKRGRKPNATKTVASSAPVLKKRGRKPAASTVAPDTGTEK